METDENVFNREKIRIKEIISEQCISDLELNLGRTAENFINNELTVLLTGHVFSKTIEERTLSYYCEPPTFFDWLFRRRKKVNFDFKIKDLLINPPKNTENTIRIYDINQSNSI